MSHGAEASTGPAPAHGGATRALLVFEGGGAKGIAHVGALAAAEDPLLALDIRGAAGTSAGAIVAGLVAAGYGSRDIFDPQSRPPSGRGVLDTLGLSSPTEVFGRRGPVSGWFLLSVLRSRRWQSALLLGAFAVLAGVDVAASALAPGAAGSPWYAAAAQLAVAGLALYAGLLGLRLGVCRTDAFADAYDKALRARVGNGGTAGGGGPRVTFRELHDALPGRVPKIVATRVDTGEAVVFGTHETPGVPVAEAVAASVCLPGVFRPAAVSGFPGALFYDGGLVSNLPVWTFDEERLLDPDAVTIAFEITAPPAPREDFRLGRVWPWLLATLRAAVFGAGVLDRRGANGLVGVELRSSVGLLDFDMPAAKVRQEIENGRRAASSVLLDRLVERPRTFDRACDAIRELAEEALRARPRDGAPAGQTRVFLAVPLGTSGRVLQLAFASPRARRTIEASVLPVEGSQAGQSWLGGEALFDEAPFDTRTNLGAPENARRRELTRQAVQWRLTLPIFSAVRPPGGRPAMVLCLDGDGAPAAARAALLDEALAQRLAAVVSRACDAFGV